MPHQCENILAAIVTLMKNASTDAGTRVYRGRTLAVEEAEGAGDVINVYEGDENSNPDDVNTRKLRSLEVFVELHKRATPTDVNDPTSLETAANDFLREVEVALEASVTLSGTCLKFEHQSTRREREGRADREYRVVTLGLVVVYRTLRTDPSTQA